MIQMLCHSSCSGLFSANLLPELSTGPHFSPFMSQKKESKERLRRSLIISPCHL